MTSISLIGKPHPAKDPGAFEDWPTVPQSECTFCHGHPAGEKEARYCEGHMRDLYHSVLDDFHNHPDGVCTETCGCMTWEDFKEKYAEDFPEDESEVTP